MTDLKDRHHLHGNESTHPLVTYTKRSGIGISLNVSDIAGLLMDPDAITIVGNEHRLGVKHDADLEAHADLPGVLDAEAQLDGNVDIIAVHLEALEVAVVTILHNLQGILGIRIHDPAVGEVVMTRITHADTHRVLLTLPEGEVIGEGATETLVDKTSIPVFWSIQLKIVEDIKAEGDLVVGLVRNQLGKSAGAQDNSY